MSVVRPPASQFLPRAWRVVLTVLLTLCAGIAHASEPVSVQFSWEHQFQFAGYYLAQERGHYREAGLDVELRPGGPAALHPVTAVADGRADFGVSNAGVSVARMNGRPVVALAAVLQSSAAVWLVQGKVDPFNLEALRERTRRLPFQNDDASELLLPFLMRGFPVSPPSERRGVALPLPGEMVAAYASTDVTEAERRFESITVIDPKDFGVDFYGEVLFTSETQLGRRPGVVARFRAASLRGWTEAFADIEGTARLIQRLYAPHRSVESLIEEGRVLRRLARPETIEVGHMTRTRWSAIAALQHAHGFGRTELDVAGFLPDLAPSVNPLWPDPVRVTMAGVIATLIASALLLLRANNRLLSENDHLVASARARQSEGVRFQFLMDVAPFPIVIYAMADGRVHYANDRALAWADPGDLPGHPIQTWLPALAPGEPLAERLRLGRSLREQEIELPAGPDGQSRWTAVTGRAIEHDGTHCAFIAFSDITARKAAEREVRLLSDQRALILRDVETLQTRLREASLRDALTGLHNRRFYDMTVQREFARCRRERLPIGLLVIDADHFKHVNDGWGHAGGDEVLRALGALLTQAFRTEDLVCRFGGEEFVVLMPGAAQSVCVARAEALREAVADLEVRVPAGVIRFTVSIGVAVCQVDAQTPDALFSAADSAVYEAKEAGRNRVVLAHGLTRPGALTPTAPEPGKPR